MRPASSITRLHWILVLAFAPILVPGTAPAQFGNANAPTFDPSIPSSGMAGATVAAFWLDVPNVYVNPALAAFQQGITYSYGTTQLLPGFTDDIYFKSHQILLGARGIGLELSGMPIESLGKIRLDYGPTEVTDINGNVIGEPNYYEEVRTLAIGVDVVALIASFQEASSGQPSTLRQRLSVAVGHTWKDLVSNLEPDLFAGAGKRTGNVKDLGALVRVAVLDRIGGTLGEASNETRVRIELAGGYAEQNWDEDFSGELRPLFDLIHYGASARLTVAPPTTGEGWLNDFGSPAIGFALAWTGVDEGFATTKTNLYGAEASLYDILYLRGGVVDENFGEGVEASFGVGVSLRYRKAIGVRFDYARYPSGDLGIELDRYQVTANLDPVRLWRLLKEPNSGG